MSRIFVVAGNYNQFVCWCRDNKVSPSSPILCYVNDIWKLQGVTNPPVIYYGTYNERRDIEEIKHNVAARTYKPVKKNMWWLYLTYFFRKIILKLKGVLHVSH